jgi:hypothetical protein
MLNAVNQQTPKMNERERKEQALLKSSGGGGTRKMIGISKYLSITTLNVSNLNSPIKRCRMPEWI